jgi:cyclin B
MASHQNPLFDLGQQSMLRMIRSARSRLSREQSIEDEKALSRNSLGQVGGAQLTGDRPKRASTARSFSGVGRHRLTRSRSSLESGNSENAAPEKPQEAPTRGGGVLGEITNNVTNTAAAPLGDQVKPVFGGALIQDPGPVQPLPVPSAASNATHVASNDYIECDARNAEDPQHVMEYLPDIFHVLQREEILLAPSPGYMSRQVHVNTKMRGILVDWLVSVQQKYKLKAETLFLAISLLDRYLEKQATARRYLQLVGVTSLLIAAKFEEIYPPQINDFVYVTDKAYSKEDIVKMEVAMLSALDFKVCRPTPVQFLERYQSINGCTEAHRDLAQYLLELTLVDYNMLKYSPSRLAAAAVLLSNKLLRRQPSWRATAEQQTHFTEQMLKECAKEMCALLEYAEQNPLQAVRKKFSQQKYHSVAKLSFTAGPPPVPPAEEGKLQDARSIAARRSVGGNERRRSVLGNDLPAGSRLPASSPGAPPPPVSSNCGTMALDMATI